MEGITVFGGVRLPGGSIKFIIQVDDVGLSEELRNAARYFVAGGATTLAVLYGWKFFKPLIKGVIDDVFGGDDGDPPEIRPGSLHVLVHCRTNERFLEVLSEYESEKIQERLVEEFAEFSFKVKGLKVEIENMEEVIKIREAISQCKRTRIIVQGGTYHTLPPEKRKEYIEATKASAKLGYAKLMQGGTAVEAVEAAVRVLEDDERFNAGYGSVLNEEGEVECDAMIMDGDTLESGAVISGRHFRNPVSLAKEIMKNTNHCALSGEGALKFAKTRNFPFCYPEQLISEMYKKRGRRVESFSDYSEVLEEENEEGHEEVRHKEVGEEFGHEKVGDEEVGHEEVGHEEVGHEEVGHDLDRDEPQEGGSDTVSAVAMDAYGHLACAMSTGGTRGKLKGRVGDVPMVGCGGYANETGAATAAGRGESIIKIILAKKVVDNMERGTDAQKCVEDGLKDMEQRAKGKGGLIAIDKHGNFGKCCSTDVIMVWASIKDDEMKHGIEADRARTNVNST